MQDQTPEATKGFGAREDADATRQGGHLIANDAQIDVHFDAITARSQTLTVDLAGKEFVAAAARRTIFADKDVIPA